MENTKQKTNLRQVQLSELGFMFGLISEEYPSLNNQEKSQKIEESFKIFCTKEDIDLYFGLMQDYELEERRHKYGVDY